MQCGDIQTLLLVLRMVQAKQITPIQAMQALKAARSPPRRGAGHD